MAVVGESIQHFTHPGHPLTEVNEATEYLCDGCKVLGYGKRYRCNICNFNLHKHCSACPTTLSSYMHPQHQLTLVHQQHEAMRHKRRVCDVCSNCVDGLFYTCEPCEFYVHPLCTQLPQTVWLKRHHQHYLTFLPWSLSECIICKGSCSSWRYRCGPCGVDVHLECVVELIKNSCPPTARPPPLPPFGAYASGFPSTSIDCLRRTVSQGHGGGGAYPFVSPAASSTHGMHHSVSQGHVGVAYPFGVPTYPTHAMHHFVNHAHGGGAYIYPLGVPAAWSTHGMHHHVNQQAHGGGAYPLGVPAACSTHGMHHHVNQDQGNGGKLTGGIFVRKMYKILETIALGVLASAIFAVII